MITMQKEKILTATCDKCGQDCMKPFFDNTSDGDRDDHDNVKEFEGMILSADWGFMSNGKDGETWKAVLCEICVDKYLSHISFQKSHHI